MGHLSLMFSISRGQLVDSGDIPLPSGEAISLLAPSDLQCINIWVSWSMTLTVKNQLIKSLLNKEHKWCETKLLCTKFTIRNLFLAVNV